MKNKLLLFVVLLLAASAAFSQLVSSDYLFWVYADSKEKVSVTVDKSRNYKYWDIADGKLLYSFNENDPANNIKLLVNNIQSQTWQERNIKRSFSFEGDNTINTIVYDGDVIATFSNNTDNKQYIALHHKTKQVVVKKTENGVTKFLSLRQNPADITQPFFEPIVSFDDSLARITSISFSPSGKYVYARFDGCMIDVAAKKTLWNDEHWNDRSLSAFCYAFNSDETKLAVTATDGVAILDVQTGLMSDKIPLPDQLKKLKNIYMFPCSDMASFILIQPCFTSDLSICAKKGWLVKKDRVIELVD